MIDLRKGDCLEVMKDIPDGSVDFVLTDPPYGTTACGWDIVIPFDKMWGELMRIAKPCAVFALFGSEPFSSMLRTSNIDMFRYDWIWEKPNGSGFLSANEAPLKNHEIISVFRLSKQQVTDRSDKFYELRKYFQEERKKTGLSSKEMHELLGNYMASHYFTNGVQFTIPTIDNYEKLQSTGYFNRDYDDIKNEYDRISSELAFTYNPQFTDGKQYECKRGRIGEVITGQLTGSDGHVTKNDGKRYPKTVLKFNKETGYHPTQKPVKLLEYLIKTYTNEGDTVLDFTMGSGSTGVACVNTGRSFVGIEMDDHYFDVAKNRIEEAEAKAKAKAASEPTGAFLV